MSTIVADRGRTVPIELPSPARPWADTPVLIALAAIVIGAVWLGTLVGPSRPGDSSAEAGFARDMSAHHAQGVEMAEVARSRTADDGIRALATDIALTQQAQIGQMSGWLAAWRLSPTRVGEPMAWMGHPTAAPMPGMATPAEVATLATVPAAGVDVAFLRLMIRHHRGGVLMARGALARASSPEVRTLAEAVANAQRAEVTAMEKMLVERGVSPVTAAVTMPPMDGHSHDGGHSLAALGPSMFRALPLAVAALAAAWLGVDGARRRRTWAGLARPVPPLARSIQWPAVAGLVAAGMLHLALAPDHFAESRPYGFFFVAAAVAQLVAAAAVVAWPTGRVLAGSVALSLTLVAVYFVFRLVAPPGADSVEGFDVVGLLTQGLQLAAAGLCARAVGRARLMSAAPAAA